MRPRIRREEIEQLLARKEREGLSYATLAEETGINRNTLASWASRLRREASSDESGFVELVVGDSGDDEDGAIELVVDDHFVVRVRRGFDAETLARVLASLPRRC